MSEEDDFLVNSFVKCIIRSKDSTVRRWFRHSKDHLQVIKIGHMNKFRFKYLLNTERVRILLILFIFNDYLVETTSRKIAQSLA